MELFYGINFSFLYLITFSKFPLNKIQLIWIFLAELAGFTKQFPKIYSLTKSVTVCIRQKQFWPNK